MAQVTWKPLQSNYQAPVNSGAVQLQDVVGINNIVGSIGMANRVVQRAINQETNQQQSPPNERVYLDPTTGTYRTVPNTQMNVRNPNEPLDSTQTQSITNPSVQFNKPISGSSNLALKYDQKLFEKYAPTIINESIKAGLNPNEMLALTYNESRFNPNAKNNRYGGLAAIDMQQHSNWADPTYNIQQAIKLNKANRAYLAQQGINQWDAGIAYLAHQQGMGGAVALLKNPNMSAAKALQQTSQWKNKSVDWLNKNIIERNGGKASMTAQEFAGMWTNKTNAYTQHFAQLEQAQGGWGNAVKFRG